MPNVLLVGATEGIGLALTRLYLGRGWSVGLLGRDPAKVEGLAAALRAEFSPVPVASVACDVTDAAALPAAFAAVVSEMGHVDLVIYSAGVLIDGDPVSSDHVADAAMLGVNALGAMHVLGLAADHFRTRGAMGAVDGARGHLAAIGSVAGERGRRGNPGYCASKAALHTYMEGMRHRLHPYGIRVSTIKPGFVKTRMLRAGNSIGALTPDEAARRIANALERGRESFFVPWWWGSISLLVRLCPRSIFKRYGPP